MRIRQLVAARALLLGELLAAGRRIGSCVGERIADLDYVHDLGEITLNISGCINACGHHHVGNIGILGIDKQGEEFNQLMLGGAAYDAAALGRIVGPAFSSAEIVDAVANILRTYVDNRESPDEQFIDYFRRVGFEPFKERLYGHA